MENGLPHSLWPLRVAGYAVRTDQCAATFQHYTNDVLRAVPGNICYCLPGRHLDLPPVPREHKKHVPQVLQALSYMGLHLAPEKCEFHQQSVKYLGSITTTEGVAPDPAKIATIQERGTPKCPIACAKDVRHFLGFANF